MFEEPIFQNHIKKIFGLEATEASVLINAYKEAFGQINNQILISEDNTFTEAKLEVIKRQLEIGIRALEARIRGELESSFNYVSEQGFEDAVKEVNTLEKKFNGINQLVPIDLILASINPNTYLFNNYTSSIQSYNEDLRAGMQNVLTQALIQRKTLNQTVSDMQQFMRNDVWRLERIIRTELHQIYNVSKMDSMGAIKEQYVPDLKKSLVHPMDKRTGQDSKELAQKNPIIPIDKPFKQIYNGKELVFMAPPNRPNDRAILIPYRESYDKR